jgi:mRNA-degrading endonuclease RelE of RelBE toxin-antitoxin system
MAWKLEVSEDARRDLRAIPKAERVAVSRALNCLCTDPSSVDFKKLRGGAGWRVRVGQWRALVSLHAKDGVIVVSRVLNRRDAYRG